MPAPAQNSGTRSAHRPGEGHEPPTPAAGGSLSVRGPPTGKWNWGPWGSRMQLQYTPAKEALTGLLPTDPSNFGGPDEPGVGAPKRGRGL